MSIERETLEKIQDALEYKRSKEPLNVEWTRLMEDVYPYKKIYSIFKLGQAQVISAFKNDLYEYMGKDGQDCIDLAIKEYRKDEEMGNLLDKLIK